MQKVESFAHAGGPGGLSGVSGAVHSSLLRQLERGAMSSGAEAQLIAGQIEGADLVHVVGRQPRYLQAGFRRLMPHAAHD